MKIPGIELVTHFIYQRLNDNFFRQIINNNSMTGTISRAGNVYTSGTAVLNLGFSGVPATQIEVFVYHRLSLNGISCD